jgi:predicted  nucleic acid-binding Zn-ribbon protein
MVSSLEERVAKIEGILEQMDKRLNHLESELRDLNKRLENLRNELYGEIRDLRKALDYRFYWLLGVQISMWVTIILTIIFK